MPRIIITIDDVDAQEYPEDCADQPWTANIQITSDDGRVSEFGDARIGATVREAIENLMQEADPDDDNAWLRRSWLSGRPEGDGFVIIDGGLVSNDPGIPVFDLDVLDTDTDPTEALHEVVDLYQRMRNHGSAALAGYIEPVVDFIRRKAPADQVDQILPQHIPQEG